MSGKVAESNEKEDLRRQVGLGRLSLLHAVQWLVQVVDLCRLYRCARVCSDFCLYISKHFSTASANGASPLVEWVHQWTWHVGNALCLSYTCYPGYSMLSASPVMRGIMHPTGMHESQLGKTRPMLTQISHRPRRDTFTFFCLTRLVAHLSTLNHFSQNMSLVETQIATRTLVTVTSRSQKNLGEKKTTPGLCGRKHRGQPPGCRCRCRGTSNRNGVSVHGGYRSAPHRGHVRAGKFPFPDVAAAPSAKAQGTGPCMPTFSGR